MELPLTPVTDSYPECSLCDVTNFSLLSDWFKYQVQDVCALLNCKQVQRARRARFKTSPSRREFKFKSGRLVRRATQAKRSYASTFEYFQSGSREVEIVYAKPSPSELSPIESVDYESPTEL